MGEIVIHPPECNWQLLPYKDKRRRGGIWLCLACKFRRTSKDQPDCPCETIRVPEANPTPESEGE